MERACVSRGPPGSAGVSRTDFRVSASKYLEYIQGDPSDGPSIPAEQVARQYLGVVERHREEQQKQPDRLVPAGGLGPHLLVAPEGRLYPPAPPVHLDEPVRVGSHRLW